MNEEQIIFGFLSLFSLIAGIGLVFVKIKNNETKKISKLFPMASLYQYKWFKYLAALLCFIIFIITGLKTFGVLQ